MSEQFGLVAERAECVWRHPDPERGIENIGLQLQHSHLSAWALSMLSLQHFHSLLRVQPLQKLGVLDSVLLALLPPLFLQGKNFILTEGRMQISPKSFPKVTKPVANLSNCHIKQIGHILLLCHLSPKRSAPSISH